jgi:hypothetical protein
MDVSGDLEDAIPRELARGVRVVACSCTVHARARGSSRVCMYVCVCVCAGAAREPSPETTGAPVEIVQSEGQAAKVRDCSVSRCCLFLLAARVELLSFAGVGTLVDVDRCAADAV